MLNDLLHQQLRSRGARRYAHGQFAGEPLRAQVLGPVDQIARHPGTIGELAQPVGVGTAARAHDQEDIALPEELFHSVLAVLGGVADVLAPRRRELRESPPQRRHHFRRVIHRQRGLGHEGEAVWIADRERVDVGTGLDQVDAPAEAGIEAPHRALNFRVPRMPDEDDVAPLTGVALHLHVHLGHQGTRGIEDGERPALRLVLHRAGNAVRGKDDRAAGRHVREFVHEYCAEPAQPLHHVAVVHHLMTHIDRRTEELDRTLDDVDGAVDAGTETARIGEQHLHQVCTWTRPAARVSSHASIRRITAPTVIAESAMLKAGK